MFTIVDGVIVTESADWKNCASRPIAILEVAVCSRPTKKLTVNDSVNFQNFVTTFCTVVAKLCSIISWKFRLNRLRFSYHQTRWVKVFFSDAL